LQDLPDVFLRQAFQSRRRGVIRAVVSEGVVRGEQKGMRREVRMGWEDKSM